MKTPAKPKIHKLPVGEGHTLHIEESGNPSGIPIIILHGGPGGAISDSNNKRFPPQIYRLIAFDQRGCGKSKAQKGPLHANTTQHSVADIEKIRTHLKIEKWVVAGASWGSTLSLAYAQSHPQHVLGLIVSSVYLGTAHETAWFTQPDGLCRFFPAEYQSLISLTNSIPATIIKKSLKILVGTNKPLAHKVAYVWAMYESMAATITPNRAKIVAYLKGEKNLLSSAQIEVHYFANNCFISPNQLLKNAGKLKGIPIHILHGWQDLVCPPESAQSLHAALPQSSLTLLPACGHYGDPAMDKARRAAAIKLAARLKKSKNPLAARKK